MEFQADLHSVRMEQRSTKIASYNCRGFKSSEDDVSQLFRDVDILAPFQGVWCFIISS